MGQKVHPYGFRLGYTKSWRSRWFAKHDYAKLLHEDLDLKEMLKDRLKAAGVSSSTSACWNRSSPTRWRRRNSARRRSWTGCRRRDSFFETMLCGGK